MVKNLPVNILIGIISLFLNACASKTVRAEGLANPAYTWRGFEIFGNHKIPSLDLQSLISIRVGDVYKEDAVSWQKWCADIKSKYALPYANCSSVRYANFDAYFVLDVVEPGDESRIKFRKEPTGEVSLATQEILVLYDNLYKRLWELFAKGSPPNENADSGYLDFSDPEMHALVLRLTQLVPRYRTNILNVLENDKDAIKRGKAANLLNWTLNDMDKSIANANRLLDDPNGEVRNNISRFTLHFIEKIQSPFVRKHIIDQLLVQLNRPSFADRNKSIFNLLYIAQKFPQDRLYLKSKGEALLTYVSTTSILNNVRDIAIETLKLIGGR